MQSRSDFFAARRDEFPSLRQILNGNPPVFFDGPGGSQAPARVGDAMAAYLRTDNANTGGTFSTSRRTDALVAATRRAMAEFIGASRPEEIVFGQNMTSLTFQLSRALARTWQAGDEIVLTSLDHDANFAPWTIAARDHRDGGIAVRTWEFRPDDGCRLHLEDLVPLLGPRTRLVALTHASNALGTIPDVAGAIRLVRERAPQARVFVDAVHYTPHGPVDVQALDCDFLACSAYKFFGPHLGILYGKYAHLDALVADKVRPSSDLPPGKWETGTQSFESIAGLQACLEYLAELGGNADDLTAAEGGDATHHGASAYKRAMRAIQAHEADLARTFLERFHQAALPGWRLHGIGDPASCHERTPTFALTCGDRTPHDVAARLAERGMFVWDGNFYAVNVVERLGLADRGGLLRIGFLHYNTGAEVERLVAALQEIAAGEN